MLLHAVKYSADADSQWVQLHCSGPREVDISGFRLQVAGTNWETQVTFPSNTWMVPGHFLLIGGTNVPDADIEADLNLPGSYSSLPTAGIRLVAPENSTNAPVDVLMYGSHVPFNEQGLDTTGWLSEATNLWASSTRHLERWEFGRDTDRENDWRHIADENIYNAEDILDSDDDGLTDEDEYRTGTSPSLPDTDGDGLEDDFEFAHGLNPTEQDTDGDTVIDALEFNSETGMTYAQSQLGVGMTVAITPPFSDWEMGSSIGEDGILMFTLTDINGKGVWATIREGGFVPEGFTYAIQGAVESFVTNHYNSAGFRTLHLFLTPEMTNGFVSPVVVKIVDNSTGAGVTNPPDLGPDISARFQAVTVNLTLAGVADGDEEDPGGFIADHTTHTNAPRTSLTLEASRIRNLPLPLNFQWDSSAVKIYDCSEGGIPLADFNGVFSSFETKTLYIEGIAPKRTLLTWGYVAQGSYCRDEAVAHIVKHLLLTFTDQPCRRLADGPLTWEAQLQVVCQASDGSPTHSVLDSIVYGFSIDGSQNVSKYINANNSNIVVDEFSDYLTYSYGDIVAGVTIIAHYEDQCEGFSLRWVQTVTTSHPLGGCTSPYNDPCPPDDSLPFYYTDAELPSFIQIVP